MTSKVIFPGIFWIGNSTVESLNVLQRASIYVPHLLYGSTTWADPSYLLSGIIVSFAIALVVVSSYATVCQPLSAVDPAIGKEDPLYDQTDEDASFHPPVHFLKPGAYRFWYSTILSFVGMMGLIKFSETFETWADLITVLFSAACVAITSYTTMSFVLDSVARQVGHFLGLKGNSGFFFKRFRITLSEENKIPLGLYGASYKDAFRMSKSGFKRYKNYMARVNYVDFTKMSYDVAAKKGLKVFVTDTKVLISMPVAVALSYLSCATSQINSTSWLLNNLICIGFVIFGVSLKKFSSFKDAAELLGPLYIFDTCDIFPFKIIGCVLVAPGNFLFPIKPFEILTLDELSTKKLRSVRHFFEVISCGEIVIPSSIISLCLRFDYYQFYKENNMPFHRLRSIGVPKYFTAAVIAYAFAISCALFTSSYTYHNPSVDLFAVPSVFAVVIGLAWTRNEIHVLWNFSEHVTPYKEGPKKRAKKRNVDRDDDEQDEINADNDKQDENNIVADNNMHPFSSDDESDISYLIGDSDDYDPVSSEAEESSCESG